MARALRKTLVVLVGLPGAGKSTLARRLCERRALALVDRDALPEKRASKAAANAAVFRQAAGFLRRRRSVVVDGMTFAREAQRRRARQVARRHGARCVELYLACPRALARERVRQDRGHPARDRTPQLVDAVARRFACVGPQAVRLDARRPIGPLLRAALAAV